MSEPGITCYICRHGECFHNAGGEKKHTFAGSYIDSELNENGIKTAQIVAEKIKEMGGCDIVLSSTLKRSYQTACIIAEILGVKVSTIKYFEEINVGDFVGHTEGEVKDFYPESANAFYSGDIPNWNFPNGEKYEDVSERLDSVIAQIKQNFKPGNKIAIIGHGMINRVLFYKIMPSETNLWQERSYPHDRINLVNI